MKPLIFTGFYDVSYLTKACGCPYPVWLSGEVFAWCYDSPIFGYILSREGGILVSIASEAKHNNFDEPKLIRVKALGDTVWINVVKEARDDGSSCLLVFFPRESEGRVRWHWPPSDAHGET